jgi:myo-inositol-1(or 4)-monophosphatase
LCHLADGQADGYFELGVNLWDYAAGALVAEGAGARVEVLTGTAGRPLVVAAPEHGFEELRDAVLEAGYGRE